MRPETQGLFGLRVCEPNLAESVLAERGRGKPRLARLVVGHCVSTKAAASRRTPKWARLGKLVERFSCPLPLHFSG
jgi:hypothetical protein